MSIFNIFFLFYKYNINMELKKKDYYKFFKKRKKTL